MVAMWAALMVGCLEMHSVVRKDVYLVVRKDELMAASTADTMVNYSVVRMADL